MTTAPAFSGEALVQAERRGAFWFVRLNGPTSAMRCHRRCSRRSPASAPRWRPIPQARGVVLWGAGGHFCAGADFGDFEQAAGGQGDSPGHMGTVPIAEHNREFGRVLERLMALPVPTLASCAARRWAAAADSRRPSTA